MWRYRTDAGTFRIRPGSAGEYELWLNDELLGECADPNQAAQHVRSHTTGHTGWDCRQTGDAPEDIQGWVSIDLDEP